MVDICFAFGCTEIKIFLIPLRAIGVTQKYMARKVIFTDGCAPSEDNSRNPVRFLVVGKIDLYLVLIGLINFCFLSRNS